jgi:hypothetical protein
MTLRHNFAAVSKNGRENGKRFQKMGGKMGGNMFMLLSLQDL